jgi:hypothetical protein
MLNVEVVLKGTQEEMDAVAPGILDHIRANYGLTFAGINALTEGVTTMTFKKRPAESITPATLREYEIPYGANFLLKHIRAQGLVDALQYILAHNTSAKLPYHNTNHMLGMTSIAIRLFMSKSSAEDIDVLILAGLFHDFGHSGGTQPDMVNIEHACAVVRDYLVGREKSDSFIDQVTQAIQCTVFPFTVQPVGWIQQCLRDADILYTALVGDPELVLEKLRSEVEVSLKRPISYLEFYEGQIGFTKNAVLYTPVGKELFELHGAALLDDMKRYVTKHTMLS